MCVRWGWGGYTDLEILPQHLNANQFICHNTQNCPPPPPSLAPIMQIGVLHMPPTFMQKRGYFLVYI
jgi:hypothetical protein